MKVSKVDERGKKKSISTHSPKSKRKQSRREGDKKIDIQTPPEEQKEAK